MATTTPQLLRTYTDARGTRRELILRSGAGGSRLVIDRHARAARDERLLAHLHPDEPRENAALICRDYLSRAPAARRCRRVHAADEGFVPGEGLVSGKGLLPGEGFVPGERPAAAAHVLPVSPVSVVGDGVRFQLERRTARTRIPELRWTRRAHSSCARTVSLREAIAEAESYEPFRALTRQAILQRRDDPAVSTITLQTELERVGASAIVLNRALREAVVRAVRSRHMSMSEIAMRCGRVKRDGRGNESGETSWLARRVGLLPEGGGGGVTPWVHSDVLGLIARRGLGISPREVELG